MPRFEFLHNGRERVAIPAVPRLAITLVALERSSLSRAELAAHLWPEVPERQRARRLRTLLWRINRLLPDTPVLKVSEGHVILVEQSEDIDLHAAWDLAQALVRQAISKQEVLNSPPERWAPLKSIVLDGESDEQSFSVQQEWNHLRLLALDSLSQMLLAGERILLAIEMAESAIKVDPLSESPYRTITSAFIHRSDNATAWRVYQDYSKFVEAELGLMPSFEYQDIVSRMKA
ncbi:BTAD domain-containing putative transcriptional regulator [Streptomyces sp. NBC_00212]|uniref:AfsR/SARP family transcriptional regulator n=1 Tax=Streptomyces sp. NBC_00212 TaxID=2975684 RepID=UPI002F917536